MLKTIEIAKVILAEMFGITVESFDIKGRKAEAIEARRFLIYYLFTEWKMKISYIHPHMKAIKDHATAIYHRDKMKYLLIIEPLLVIKYQKFVDAMDGNGVSQLQKEVVKKIEKRSVISADISRLKKLIDEA